jgi:hypothetical protein
MAATRVTTTNTNKTLNINAVRRWVVVGSFMANQSKHAEIEKEKIRDLPSERLSG